jgi:hypothetical protein
MTQGKRRPWRDPDNTALIAHWDVVRSVALIAIMMSRTQSSVQTQASRLGLPPRTEERGRHRRRWLDEDDTRLDALIARLREEDGRIPIQGVADEMGRSVDAVVARLVGRHGEDSDVLAMLVAPPLPAMPEPNSDRSAPGAKPPQDGDGQKKKKGKTRQCLKCRKSFWSEGNHNWICVTCKRSDDWDFDY